MSNQLTTNINEIKRQKDTYLLPENLKQGVTVLGVTGTLSAGIDTSDATASDVDILDGQTAYANGEKIVGTMQNLNNSELTMSSSQVSISGDNVVSRVQSDNTGFIGHGTEVLAYVPQSAVATAAGLTSDKIITGETILGVVGAATAQDDGVKLVNSVDDLPQNPNFGDICVVTNSELTELIGIYRYTNTWELVQFTNAAMGEEYEQLKATTDNILGTGGTVNTREIYLRYFSDGGEYEAGDQCMVVISPTDGEGETFTRQFGPTENGNMSVNVPANKNYTVTASMQDVTFCKSVQNVEAGTWRAYIDLRHFGTNPSGNYINSIVTDSVTGEEIYPQIGIKTESEAEPGEYDIEWSDYLPYGTYTMALKNWERAGWTEDENEGYTFADQEVVISAEDGPIQTLELSGTQSNIAVTFGVYRSDSDGMSGSPGEITSDTTIDYREHNTEDEFSAYTNGSSIPAGTYDFRFTCHGYVTKTETIYIKNAYEERQAEEPDGYRPIYMAERSDVYDEGDYTLRFIFTDGAGKKFMPSTVVAKSNETILPYAVVNGNYELYVPHGTSVEVSARDTVKGTANAINIYDYDYDDTSIENNTIIRTDIVMNTIKIVQTPDIVTEFSVGDTITLRDYLSNFVVAPSNANKTARLYINGQDYTPADEDVTDPETGEIMTHTEGLDIPVEITSEMYGQSVQIQLIASLSGFHTTTTNIQSVVEPDPATLYNITLYVSGARGTSEYLEVDSIILTNEITSETVPLTLRTDTGNPFYTGQLVAGEYALEIQEHGYETYTTSISVLHSEGDVQYQAELVPDPTVPVPIEIQVYEPDMAMPGAVDTITLVNTSTGDSVTLTGGEDPERMIYVYTGSAVEGSYAVTIEKSGYSTFNGEIYVSLVNTSFNFTLLPDEQPE